MIKFKLTTIKHPVNESKNKGILAVYYGSVYVLTGSISRPHFTSIDDLKSIDKPVGFGSLVAKKFLAQLNKRDYIDLPSDIDLAIVVMVTCAGFNGLHKA